MSVAPTSANLISIHASDQPLYFEHQWSYIYCFIIKNDNHPVYNYGIKPRCVEVNTTHFYK